jgi:hypothetical protein
MDLFAETTRVLDRYMEGATELVNRYEEIRSAGARLAEAVHDHLYDVYSFDERDEPEWQALKEAYATFMETYL